MTDVESPCTREEALHILRIKLSVGVEPNPTPEVIASCVTRLQTLPDADLSVLAQSEPTFAIVESNRRFLAALQKEARRTTYLTILIALVAVATLVMAGFQVYAEYFRPD